MTNFENPPQELKKHKKYEDQNKDTVAPCPSDEELKKRRQDKFLELESLEAPTHLVLSQELLEKKEAQINEEIAILEELELRKRKLVEESIFKYIFFRSRYERKLSQFENEIKKHQTIIEKIKTRVHDHYMAVEGKRARLVGKNLHAARTKALKRELRNLRNI